MLCLERDLINACLDLIIDGEQGVWHLQGLRTQNLHDHMSEAELIFTPLAELSTRKSRNDGSNRHEGKYVAGKKWGQHCPERGHRR